MANERPGYTKTSFWIEDEDLMAIKRRVIEERSNQTEFINKAIKEALKKPIIRPVDKQVVFENENKESA